jgi:hypothetical protein
MQRLPDYSRLHNQHSFFLLFQVMAYFIPKMAGLAFLSLALLAGCSEDASSPANITGGNWRVDYLGKPGDIHTQDLVGYTFSFDSAGVFKAIMPGGSIQNGIWGTTSSSSSKLIIQITGSEGLDELSDDWDLVSATSNRIEGKDDSDATERVVFVK